jgi:hypothetical protein
VLQIVFTQCDDNYGAEGTKDGSSLLVRGSARDGIDVGEAERSLNSLFLFHSGWC